MATYTKLKNGDWGIRVEGKAPKVGDKITVTKKSGERKVETVTRVVWSGAGVSLCAVSQTAGSGSTKGRTCAACGRAGALVHDMEDGLMKHYSCCDMPE